MVGYRNSLVRWLGFGIVAVGLGAGSSARAADVDCGTQLGTCELNNDEGSNYVCHCIVGGELAGDAGDAWSELSALELLMACPDITDSICPPLPPPLEWVSCFNSEGGCNILNDPEDNLWCECLGGNFGIAGGNLWAGLGDDQLMDVCVENLEALCGEGSTTTGESGGSEESGDPSDSGGTDWGSSTSSSSSGDEFPGTGGGDDFPGTDGGDDFPGTGGGDDVLEGGEATIGDETTTGLPATGPDFEGTGGEPQEPPQGTAGGCGCNANRHTPAPLLMIVIAACLRRRRLEPARSLRTRSGGVPERARVLGRGDGDLG